MERFFTKMDGRDAVKALTIVDKIEVDRSLPQELLDLQKKNRKNLHPWRGQFTPEFIELFLIQFRSDTKTVLDPFAGSGTTVIEAACLGFNAYGVELNPVSVEMGRVSYWIKLSPSEREKFISQSRDLVKNKIGSPLMNYLPVDTDLIKSLLSDAKELSSFVYNIIVTSLARAASRKGNSETFNAFTLWDNFEKQVDIIRALPYKPDLNIHLFHGDARKLPLGEEEIDLIITSPPYINVFNYHQNYRAITEAIGVDPLCLAKSEIGANRKFRSNRFLTVIQYSIDISIALLEMRRVLRRDGTAVIVIGRESMVRKRPVLNYRIIMALALLVGFEINLRRERKFKNRFGQTIIEDIIYLKKTDNSISKDPDLLINDARVVAEVLLSEMLPTAPNDVAIDIKKALERSNKIKPSDFFVTF